MKTTVSKYDFREAFRTMGRQDQFTYDALGLLFDWVEELDEACGTETELDVIAFCCDFSEEPWEDIADNYSIDTAHDKNEEDAKQTVEEYLLENTSLVGITDAGDFVYAAF